MLKLENVTYIYNKQTPAEKMAIKNINLSISKGEFVGIVGQTGSGKSTLIEQLNGLKKPDLGRVLLEGNDIWSENTNIREVRFRIGMVFQCPESQMFEKDVFSELAFAPKNMNLSEEEIKVRVDYALDFVGLSANILGRSPFDFSCGQERKIAIASVIAMKPDVLILDEPTAGLDPVSAEQLLDRLKSYHSNENRTVILVSHNMEEVAQYTKRVIVMNDGSIVMDGKTSEVFKDPEQLTRLNLDIPRLSQVFWALRDKGVQAKTDIYELKTAIDEFFRLKTSMCKKT